MGNFYHTLNNVTHKLGIHSFLIKKALYHPLLIRILTILNRLRWKEIDLTVILWPPAIDLFEVIQEDIKKKYKILSIEKIEIRADKFEDFIHRLYAIDFADPRKIAKKMDRLLRPPHLLCVMQIRIPNPKMVVQDGLNRVRCETIGDMKDSIRKKYKERVPDYIYDIIIHSTEADYQNPVVESLIEKYKI